MPSTNDRKPTTKKSKLSRTSPIRKPSARKYHSPVRKKRPNAFVRILQKTPNWVWWFGGALIVSLYLYFFYYFFVGPFGFRWRALYGEVTYPEGYEIRGIDISHYQGNINWNQLRNDAVIDKSPIRFVMIKATEGSDRVDECFANNFRNARDYGYLRGAYHFWSNQSGAISQASHFIRTVKLEQGDLPPVLDVEHKPNHMSVEEFQDSLKSWLDTIEKHYDTVPILYTYYKFKKKYLNDTIFDRYPYWIAHYYVDSIEYKGKWKFWQHTDRGRLPGINGFVDLNIYNGSYYDLQQMTISSVTED